MSEKEALLQKLKALAERGVGGEKETAARLLKKLMAKYDVSEQDLDDQRQELREFRWSKPYEDKLLHQVCYMVLGKHDTYHYRGSRKKVALVRCTQAQRIEIEAAFDFYRHYLEEALAKCYQAFITAEGIFPDAGKTRDENAREVTEEEYMMAAVLGKHERHAAITDGSEKGANT